MKILIVEDEPHIAWLLERKVKKIRAGRETHINRVTNLEEAIDHLDKQEFGLLLLDLNLGGKDGFEVLQFLSAGAFHTIVISAYGNRAIEAFEYGVIDFVPKPFSEERLRKALARVDGAEQKPEHPTKYYAVRKKGRVQLIKDEEVIYFQALGHYSRIHMRNGETELHNKSLARLYPLLSNAYERVHKSYIVKMSEVKDILVFEGGKYELELNNGDIIPMGRTKYRTISKKWIG